MYHPTAKELSTSIGVPMEGFFDGADLAFATPITLAAAHGVPAKALIPSSEPVPRDSVISSCIYIILRDSVIISIGLTTLVS